jgi:alpha-1,2-mannosyltransferase
VTGGIAIAVGIAVAAFFIHGWQYVGTDVYHGAGRTVLQGGSPYDFASKGGLLFIYPPFAVLPILPLAFLGVNFSFALWILLSVLALEITVWMSLGFVGTEPRSRKATLTLVLTAAALPLAPFVENFWFGQINLIVLLLIIGDLARKSERLRGVGVGIAAGIKLIPLIFIIYLLITRRLRAGISALASFAATVVVGFALLPQASARYWDGMFWDTSRILPDSSGYLTESLRGLIAPLPSDTRMLWLWMATAAVVGAGGLAIAAWAGRSGNESAGIVACAVTSLLISPITWAAHWVWCVVILIFWGQRAWRDGRRADKLGIGSYWLILHAYSYVSVLFLLGRLGISTGTRWAVKYSIAVGLSMLVAIAVSLWRNERRTARGPRFRSPLKQGQSLSLPGETPSSQPAGAGQKG